MSWALPLAERLAQKPRASQDGARREVSVVAWRCIFASLKF